MVDCFRDKSNQIREMLLKTVGKSPDLFCYYVAIQEAKELLGKNNTVEAEKINFKLVNLKKITDC